MPSVANCNVPNKSRRKSNRNKIQRRRATAGIAKNPRGMALSTVIHPTSGPLAPLSGKKARKVEKARNHARQRALEKELAERGEVSMTDAPVTTKSKNKASEGAGADGMDVDEAL
ncbi:hypothetical protein VC83_00636 [Pseudogymnoascus destructans]|uniref:Ribosome biogenesis protein ALB1 n=2 Tax=Pseudogymnoascus destructans TaxID=655981 RepID=L8FRD5_PSED2|nr:uncharacterized protein VC83_00636 [Pseudogymnoascus destructans]ELR02266.1 hypothetical protein GMDG_05336 [Pseudogymnoascus destructans 20631-21]OAF63180.1 hypothetical protein VC83_00636 [Pseudogymnoascus destructans]